ncbi:hypothetical protein ACJJID_05040 [Microbulbifer sp. CnH-101-G]|uniref:hypothetical protein n=1 Tax=Microbulbifer sp. CnH-101-G TaxID=3243393 RepID=UPI00403A6CA3
MIEYKYPDEEQILFHYADKMGDAKARAVLEKREVANEQEAQTLSSFYWKMVDVMADDRGQGLPVLEREGFESWAEAIFHTLNGYLVSNGYEEQWDNEEE